jgi:PAS domain S-box-containing protein
MDEATNGGRDRSYQDLRESEELHRATLSNISDAVFMTDDEGAFRYVCPNVDVIFGYGPDEVRAMATIDRLLGAHIVDLASLEERIEIRNIERQVTAKSGEQRWVLVHAKRVSIKGGTVLYTCRDVTERRQTEEALREARLELSHATRLAVVGELVGSMAHEITQPITAILLRAAAGRHLAESAGDVEMVQAFSDIESDGARASATIDHLRTLMRKRPLDLQPVDINAIVQDTMRFVEGDAFRRGVRVELDLGPALPAVRADRASLQQVVLNLAVNAMDAMEGVAPERRRLQVRTRGLAGAVSVAVIDAGPGVGPDQVPKLFTAFYTTKSGGLGLGLSIARSIVEAHDGTIQVERNDSGGATFRFTVPAAAGHA